MRYSNSHKDKTHARIVKIASRRFRGEGIGNVGVASLMKSAGLTHGGFYAHFPAKDELVAEACEWTFGKTIEALRMATEDVPPGQKLAALVENYLSEDHRDRPERGCFAAALAPETARMSPAIRDAMTRQLENLSALIKETIEADGLLLNSDIVLSTMVGALTLSRTISDPARSKAILVAARQSISNSQSGKAPDEH